jgi:hypothetical protein
MTFTAQGIGDQIQDFMVVVDPTRREPGLSADEQEAQSSTLVATEFGRWLLLIVRSAHISMVSRRRMVRPEVFSSGCRQRR